MKTLILAISLFFAGSLWAEWSSIGDNDVDTLYVDLESMHPRGHMRRVLELQDLKRRGKKGELSVLTKLEFDCSKSTYRILAVTTYAGSWLRERKFPPKRSTHKHGLQWRRRPTVKPCSTRSAPSSEMHGVPVIRGLLFSSIFLGQRWPLVAVPS